MQLRARRTDGLCWGWSFLYGTMSLLGCSLLVGCDDQIAKNSAYFCQWKFFNNTRVRFGGIQRLVATVTECQSICEASAICKGFDWSALGEPDNQCILHTTQDGKQPANNIVHYDKGNCTDCYWYQTNNVKVGDSTRNPAPDVDACQSVCLFSDNCQSIDWVNDGPKGQQCQLVSSYGNKVPAPGVTHFDYHCFSGCRFIRLDDFQIIGGTVNPAGDIANCLRACVPRFGCKGVDFKDYEAPGRQCYILLKNDGLISAPGVTHFGFVCSTDCEWRRMDGLQIIGGLVIPAPDIVSCQFVCIATPYCKSVDWAFYKDPGQKCSLLLKNDGKTLAPGVTHFDLLCNAANL